MGATNNTRRKTVDETPHTSHIHSAEPGSVICACLFEKWQNENYRKKHSYFGKANFSNVRGGLRWKGVLVRQDTTEGRFISVTKISKTHIELNEPQTGQKCFIEIPQCNTSGKILSRTRRLDHREVLRSFIQKQSIGEGICVIGCRDNIAVVQMLDRTGNYIPEFYIIDMDKLECLGKYPCPLSELVWHECYISPDLSRIILRPDFLICGSVPIETSSKITATYNHCHITYLTRFPDKSRCDIISFDNRFRNSYIWRGIDRELLLYDIQEDKILLSSGPLQLQAPIKQIKSSPSGDYLALRCVYPIYSVEYQVNMITVVTAEDFHLLFTINAKGPYWPCSELVNLQMFPQFSVCESSIAIMHNKVTKRKVHLYKLPVVTLSLQKACRKVLLMYFSNLSINNFFLPNRLKDFLNYKDGLNAVHSYA